MHTRVLLQKSVGDTAFGPITASSNTGPIKSAMGTYAMDSAKLGYHYYDLSKMAEKRRLHKDCLAVVESYNNALPYSVICVVLDLVGFGLGYCRFGLSNVCSKFELIYNEFRSVGFGV